jgi:hypothetical protein
MSRPNEFPDDEPVASHYMSHSNEELVRVWNFICCTGVISSLPLLVGFSVATITVFLLSYPSSLVLWASDFYPFHVFDHLLFPCFPGGDYPNPYILLFFPFLSFHVAPTFILLSLSLFFFSSSLFSYLSSLLWPTTIPRSSFLFLLSFSLLLFSLSCKLTIA